MELLTDIYFMRQALAEAQLAFEKNEVPVGAVIVADNRIIARGHNQTELLHDITAHAEMLAISAAANFFNAKYLTNCTLYVTLEPCTMCAGALAWAKIGRVVFGASDPKKGFSQRQDSLLHPKTQISKGVLQQECEDLLKVFFKKKR